MSMRRPLSVVAAAVAAAVLGAVAPPASQAASSSTLAVNLAQSTGAFMGGASGALYGLSENNVTGDDIFDPLNDQTLAQGPANGAQHPNGHTDQVAPELFGTGGSGKYLLDYMQDYYAGFPYPNPGISSYLSTVDTIVNQVTAGPYASKYVFVPFNEPDNIWYDLHPGDSDFTSSMAQFESDWATVYTRIRSDDPGALIAGPNIAAYNSTVMSDFLAYAKANNVLPNLITWHVLSPGADTSFPSDYANLKSIESSDGIAPIPVDIDEYGNNYQLSDPGEMVQLVSMFETAKVDADLAYWTISDDYDDTTVRNDEPNGQWWLMYWYGQLTGNTVAVTPPSPGTLDTLQGLATLDTAKKQARVIVADPTGASDSVKISGLSASTFGSKVHVSVQQDNWSGYDGSDYTPLDTAETNYTVSSGAITVPLGTTNPMSAYQIIVTPATSATITAPAAANTQTYLAANAALTDATVYPQGSQSNPQAFATAGGEDVGSIDNSDSKVAFTVNAPTTGRYLLSTFYGNQTGTIAQQAFQVNSGAWSFINYAPTLTWDFRSHLDQYVNLNAGSNTISYAVSAPSIGTAIGQVTLDDIQLTYAPGAVPGVTGPGTAYPAAYAQLSGTAATTTCTGSGCLAPQSVALGSSGTVSFAVDAGSDGFYSVTAAGSSGSGTLTVDGTSTATGTVYLHAGINPIIYSGTGALAGLSVTSTTGTATTYAASSSANTLGGSAQVVADSHAYGGSYVGNIGDNSANSLTFNGVNAPTAGTYRIMVSYADGDGYGTTGGGDNDQLIDRSFTMTTSAGSSVTTAVRNTYSYDQFDTIMVTAKLNAGSNSITFSDPTYWAPNIDKIIVAPAAGTSGTTASVVRLRRDWTALRRPSRGRLLSEEAASQRR